MSQPNPEIRPIFMDEGKVICDRCVNKDVHGYEEPCASCKWLTGVMSDTNFFKEDKVNAKE